MLSEIRCAKLRDQECRAQIMDKELKKRKKEKREDEKRNKTEFYQTSKFFSDTTTFLLRGKGK